ARMIISGRAGPGARLNGMLSKLEPPGSLDPYAGAQCADHDDGPTLRQCGYSIWLGQGCMAAPRRELAEELPGRSKRSEHSGRRISIQQSNALHSGWVSVGRSASATCGLAPAAGSDDQGWREVYHLASACPIWPGESSWRKCRPGTVTSAWLGQRRQKARSSADMMPGSALMNSLGTGLEASHRPLEATIWQTSAGSPSIGSWRGQVSVGRRPSPGSRNGRR